MIHCVTEISFIGNNVNDLLMKQFREEISGDNILRLLNDVRISIKNNIFQTSIRFDYYNSYSLYNIL